MAKLHSRIRILGKDYEVSTKTRKELPNEYGLCDCETQVIHVRTDVCSESVADTVLHECLHAIDFTCYLELSERQVHATAAGLVALFSDNPWLLDFIKSSVKRHRHEASK